MFEKPEIMGMAAAMAANASARMSAIAQNVANADTPGYRAKDAANFGETYRASSDFLMNATRKGHLGAVATGADDGLSARPGGHLSPNGNNVSLEGEMMRAATVRQDHDTALTIYKTSLNILRASIGRR